MVAWILSHHLHLKFKLVVGKFARNVKAKHCWGVVNKLLKQKKQCFALLPQVNFPANDLNFH